VWHQPGKFGVSSLAAILLLAAIALSCASRPFLKNQTRPGGYAMGEKVELRFLTNRVENPPDSIAVFVLENNTKFQYSIWAGRERCDSTCQYGIAWDGRKPDGSWPAGGRYLVYAKLNDEIFSDTVQFGLAD
jgi:hypothetical protein